MGTSTAHGSTSGRSTTGKTQDVFQKIVNNRKSYKMLKGAAEAVWPPHLEETLLKGFESYEPEDCRETRLLGRFPMRNQYISDYIYRATGKRRTAKQVGSRLQQLRDTPEGKRLLNSLMQHYNLGGKASSTATPSGSPISNGSSSSGFPTSPTSPNSSVCSQSYLTPLDTSIRRTFVCIDLLPMDPISSCSTYDAVQFHGAPTPADGIFSSNGVTNVFRPSSRPRPICTIDPTITFVSQSVITAQSSCSVLLDGATVHEEVTPLMLAGPCHDGHGADGCSLLYGVQLVPSYWRFLCLSPDLTRYTIVQRVARLVDSLSSQSVMEDSLMFSAVYHFSYPPPSLSPVPVRENNEADSFEHSPLDNRQLNYWSANSLSPMHIGALSDTSDTTVENQSTAAESSEECSRSAVLALDDDIGTSKGLFPADSAAVSPISSCFPMDLSNYIV